MNGIHILYKNLGETPLETIERFKKDNTEYVGISMTYAGRLDPMAEGVLLVLSGDAIAEKQKYLDLPKTYTFQILWGVATDSLDVLGLVSGESDVVPRQDLVEKEIKNMTGKFHQKYPLFSSKIIATKFNGKHVFPWSRPGMDKASTPVHKVEIHEGHFISRESISGEDILNTITKRISLVTGDFRQKETIENWQNIIESRGEYIIDIITLTVSRGFYVRQFVSDLAENLGTVATTFHIKRDKVGDLQVS